MSHTWMPLYVADYLGDTGELSTLEHGAYMLLIMHYWQKRGLPTEDEKLARICRMDAESFAKAKLTLSSFFGRGWRHARIDDELALADEKHKKRSEAGKKGGRPRRNESNDEAELSQSLSDDKAGTNQPQSQSPNSSVASATGGEPPSYPADPVERLWAEGLDVMRSMGASDREARSNIGRWLRDQRGDAVAVLGAIIQARTRGTKDPIALVSRILKPAKPNGIQSDDKSVHRAADRLVDRVQQFLADGEPEPMLAISRK